MILNAILSVLRGGLAWRSLPHDFPPGQTVYGHLHLMRLTGLWDWINVRLRRLYRERIGRTADVRAAIVHSQSSQTAENGGGRGFDANKKVNGRKRHTLVESWAFCEKSWATRPVLQTGQWLVEAVKGQFPTLQKIWAEQG